MKEITAKELIMGGSDGEAPTFVNTHWDTIAKDANKKVDKLTKDVEQMKMI